MTNVLILYYSTYGHIEKMAYAAADGAQAVPRAEVIVKRVPEMMPRDLAAKIGAKLDQSAPIAQPLELANYDAILFGTPTRYGNTWPRRCAISSIRPATSGSKGRLSARLAASSAARRVSMADRRQR